MDDQSLDKLYPTVTFYPKRWTAMICAVGFAAGIAGIVWMGKWNAWEVLFLIFCVFAFLASVVEMIPGSSYLRLDESGFTITSGFRPSTTPWSAVDAFYVVQIRASGIKAHSMVGFNFDPASDQAKIGRRIAKFISQCEGALPDTYGMKAEALCELMNRYRIQAKGIQEAT